MKARWRLILKSVCIEKCICFPCITCESFQKKKKCLSKKKKNVNWCDLIICAGGGALFGWWWGQRDTLEFSFELLRLNRRYLAVVGFRNDCGLDQAKKQGKKKKKKATVVFFFTIIFFFFFAENISRTKDCGQEDFQYFNIHKKKSQVNNFTQEGKMPEVK